jgi:DNA-binding winged helix-turn-helix (wHTH) protein/predicted ATPase
MGARPEGEPVIRFGIYHLDPIQGLRRGNDEVRLTPKALSVLCFLAARPDQVVSKETLFGSVWPGTAVTDSALTSCIQEIRHALGDDAHSPRFIQTLHRRGYRFIAAALLNSPGPQVPQVGPPAPEPPETVPPEARPIIGRGAALQALADAARLATSGKRQFLLVTGEQGIGKTAVVETFLAKQPSAGGTLLAWGKCIQHYGAGEPYQPLLEALMRLARGPEGSRLVQALEQHSPSWLAQLPSLVTPTRFRELQQFTVGTAPGRMLRELTAALEAFTATAPLVLWLEDLQWSDSSTLDWIASFMQRPEPARLLLIGTARPVPATAPATLSWVLAELESKDCCKLMALQPLDESEVSQYLATSYPADSGDRQALVTLARRIHRHTGGNPLFLVNLVDDLAAKGIVARHQGDWRVSGDVTELGVPDDLKRLIESRLNALPASDHALLEAASVAGESFSAALAAVLAGLSVQDAERGLAALARGGLFVDSAGEIVWPGGVVAEGFAFRHSLYREVLYGRITTSRRAELHRQSALTIEAAYGEAARDLAAELAMHWERCGDSARAADSCRDAGENAQRCGGYGEAETHFRRALELIARQAPGTDRDERELDLQIKLGGILMARHGWGTPHAAQVFARAETLCHSVRETPRNFSARWGLWLFRWGRGPLSTADRVAQELMTSARTHRDRDDLLLQAHHAGWATAFLRGDLGVAQDQAREGARIYVAGRHAATAAAYGNHDAGVCCRLFLARSLALGGKASQAVSACDQALSLAQEIGHPLTLALAHGFAAGAHQTLRNVGAVRAHAAAALNISREQGFGLMLGWAAALHAWADQDRLGVTEALSAIRKTGNQSFLPYFLALAAETFLVASEPRPALRLLDEAFALTNLTGERFWEPEMHRLRGELALLERHGLQTATAHFSSSIHLASHQGADLLALRATVALIRADHQTETAQRRLTSALLRVDSGLAAEPIKDVLEANFLLAGGVSRSA